MAKRTPVTPTYAGGDLAAILAIEHQQIEDTIADMTEEQMQWRPHPKAKSALEIIWHLAYDAGPTRPATKPPPWPPCAPPTTSCNAR